MMLADEQTAIHWACARGPVVAAALVSEAPWSRVYRLRGGGAVRYLKTIATPRRVEVAATRALGRHFPALVPSYVDGDPAQGLLLLDDHGGRELDSPRSDDLVAVIDAYARMQIRAATIPELLAIPPTLALDSLVDRLSGLFAPTACVRSLLTADDVELAVRWLDRVGPRLAELVGRAAALPWSVEHGDLHAGNIARRLDGSVVLLDWGDVVVGPVGLSLAGLLGGCEAVVNAVAADAPASPIGRYVELFEEASLASRDTLRAALPASAIAGSVRTLCDFELFSDTAEDSARAFIRQQVRVGLATLAGALSCHAAG